MILFRHCHVGSSQNPVCSFFQIYFILIFLIFSLCLYRGYIINHRIYDRVNKMLGQSIFLKIKRVIFLQFESLNMQLSPDKELDQLQLIAKQSLTNL